MNKKQFQKLAKITKLAYELNRENFTVFVDFSGHVDELKISWHLGGWTSGADRDGAVYFRLDRIIADHDFEHAFQKLNEASLMSDNRAAQIAIDRIEKEREKYEELKKKFG